MSNHTDAVAAAAQAPLIDPRPGAHADGGATPLGRLSWALFEWARSPYIYIVYIYIFGPYFSTQVITDPVRGQEIWGYINGFVGIVTAGFAPILGAIVDRAGPRKPWIAAFLPVMVLAIAMLWIAEPGAGGTTILAVAVALALAQICFAFTEVFHNAMLPSIAPYRQLGRISGLGFALGNLAALVVLAGVLYAFALPASGLLDLAWLPDSVAFGLDTATHEQDRIAAPIAAVWLAVFALPLFLFTPDLPRHQKIGARRTVREGLTDLWQTIRSLRHYRNVATYLLSRMLYNDAFSGILIFGMIFASGLFGWGVAERITLGLFITIFAALGGFAGGWIDDRLGSRNTLLFVLSVVLVALIASVSLTRDTIGWVQHDALGEPVWDFVFFRTPPELVFVAIWTLFAFFLTAGYASSRTMLARIAPEEEMAKFFGLYALSGQITVFLAPMMVAFFTGFFQSQRIGFGSLAILLFAGTVGLVFVREERAPPRTAVAPRED